MMSRGQGAGTHATREKVMCTAQCGNVIAVDGPDTIKCAVCLRPWEFTCAMKDSGLQLETIKSARKVSTPLLWVCETCRKSIKKNQQALMPPSSLDTQRSHRQELLAANELLTNTMAMLQQAREENSIMKRTVDGYRDVALRNVAIESVRDFPEYEALRSEIEALRAERLNNVMSAPEYRGLAAQIEVMAGENLDLEKRLAEATAALSEHRIRTPMNEKKRRRVDGQVNEPEVVAPFGNAREAAASVTATENTNNDLSDALSKIIKRLDELENKVKRNQNRTQSVNRSRQRTSSSNAATVKGDNEGKERSARNARRKKITYAEALTANNASADQVRNVRIVADSSENITQRLLNDRICDELKIEKVQQRGKNFMVIKCATKEDANSVEQRLTAKYKGAIVVASAKTRKPAFKIVNIPADLPKLDIVSTVKDQNQWLTNATLEVIKHYPVHGERNYVNAIIECTLETLKRVVSRGSVIIGLQERKCFEYIEPMQCLRCQGFGHFSYDCPNNEACKKCGGRHGTNRCEAEPSVKRCINCVRHNKKNKEKPYSTSHAATDPRCSSREERVNGLIEYQRKLKQIRK